MFAQSFDQGALPQLRAELGRCGSANGLVDLRLTNFVLAVNEIATNAVRHGGGTGHIDLWRREDRLWCRITDSGRGIPKARLGQNRPRPGHIGGWGLWLARHISDSLDIESGKSGTSVVLSYSISRDR